MKVLVKEAWHDGLSDDVLDLLLDEADRALLDVEARTDEPSRRVKVHEGEHGGLDELRLAMAELSDAYPGMQYELESIGDRLRNVGAIAATTELEQHPHIIHMVRMSLEVFFRQYPTVDAYESHAQQSEEEGDEEVGSPVETYDTYRQLLEMLRRRIS